MSVCTHRLGDDAEAGLQCVRTTPHDPGRGCVYESTSGVPHAEKEE